ncbi:uncharacterized protein LOC129598406 [Paramacrobiotus metropolitanus]|uniref:uncharacterized protein LOC129598406 n=1 Tax=Paramacrobiotus metropolitanus TaxID=2943436 RepID=UPI002446576B|nr:uncharacterized protein LOC129598406 [Paramacrobiotus metropolitanus]
MPSGMHRENAVKVLFDDGMMRYARVVDAAEDGLFVDLLCPDRRREFVPFDRLFVLSKTSEADLARICSKQSSNIPVEVLVEETKLGPWIWISGQAVRFGHGMEHGIVVKWRRPCSGEDCTDFVPSERIRWTVQTELNLLRLAHLQRKRTTGTEDASDYHTVLDHVGPGTFVKQTLQLDDVFRSLSTEEIEALMKRLTGSELDALDCTVAVVDVVDGRVVYICRPSHSRRDDSWTRRVLAAVASFDEEMVSVSKLTHEVPTAHDQMALPGELFMEVFSHLVTVTQMGLRAVCAAWNTMLYEPVLSGRITISLEEYTGSLWRFHRFLPMATVYKRLQRGTQHIGMTHTGVRNMPTRSASIEDLMQLCVMINYVAQQRTGIRLRSLHLDNFSFDVLIHSALDGARVTECVLHQADASSVKTDVNWDLPQLSDLIAVCSRLPCNTLLLTRCRVHMVGAYYFLEQVEEISVSVKIRTTRLPINADFGCALWEALDAFLPVANERKLQELMERLKHEQELEQVVCKMLCALQSADPRPSDYRGKQWCVDGLRGMQLEKLSRFTRLLLVRLQTMTSTPSGFVGVQS